MRPCLAFCGSTAVILFASSLAGADYKESYRSGMEAVDRENWPEVALRMREAAAEQPAEGERLKLYGMRFETYLPNYYLGLALYNGQDCRGAVLAFQASEGQGAVQKTPQFKSLKSKQADCQRRLAESAPPRPTLPAGPDPAAVAQAVQRAEADLAKADEVSGVLAGLEADPALRRALQRDEGWTTSYRQARDWLAAARGKLAAGRGKNDLAELSEARDLAARASQQLEALRKDALRLRQALASPPASPRPSPPPTTLAVKPLPGPPPVLVFAAQAYFSGRYRETLDTLSMLGTPPGRTGVHTLVFRAAARYSLYVTGGEQDDRLRQEALADVQSCRQLDPAFTPDAKAFSPRFTKLFDETR
jgi:hypothetical protein